MDKHNACQETKLHADKFFLVSDAENYTDKLFACQPFIKILTDKQNACQAYQKAMKIHALTRKTHVKAQKKTEYMVGPFYC